MTHPLCFGKVCCLALRAERERALKLDEYLQIKAAAAYLGISQNTLRNWERAGKIVTYRHPINGYRLYKQSDLAHILAAITPSDHSKPHT